MGQTKPSYPNEINKIDKNIKEVLFQKYSINKVCNIICLFKQNEFPSYYFLEKNELNLKTTKLPKSKRKIPFVRIDLTSNNKIIHPNYEELSFLKLITHQNLSDYILSEQNKFYNSIDLDYVFLSNKGWIGFEFTTFYMKFTNKKEAERLISKINLRPSWKTNGALALKNIYKCSIDLDINFFLVCANTIDKVGSKIDIKGNCYIFKLNYDEITRLENGLGPSKGVFCKFSELCGVLENGIR